LQVILLHLLLSLASRSNQSDSEQDYGLLTRIEQVRLGPRQSISRRYGLLRDEEHHHGGYA
jgi:hypothetical protein